MKSTVLTPQPVPFAGAGSRLAQIPGLRQALLLIGIAAAVAIGVAIVLWSRSPSYALLYGSLDERDAARVVQALQAADIKYELGNGGTSIFTPAGDIAATRLRLAAQGLPHGGESGSDAGGEGETRFGMSELAERTRYQQQLEAELSSTVASLQSVKSARVHLAMPKSSAFIRDRGRPSASVMVAMYPGRQLDNSQVGAIVHLVAASVPELDPAQVSVVDQKGQLLTNTEAGDAAAVNETRFRLIRQVESSYASRIEELLTPLVGAGHVRAQVAAQLDFTETEKTSESFDPQRTVLRSEQVSDERRADAKASGLPGALSNQPPSSAPPASPAATPATTDPGKTASMAKGADGGDISSSATRNYELDRTISHTREPVGGVRRLSIAVVLDNRTTTDEQGKSTSVALNAGEVERMTDLVKNAVGFDATRGDTVSVINAAFQTDQPFEVESTPLWKQPMLRELVKQGLGALLGLLVVFAILRPLFRNLFPARIGGLEALGVGSLEPASDLLSLGSSARAGEGAGMPLDVQQKTMLAQRIANQDPRQVAQVVKSWVVEDV